MKIDAVNFDQLVARALQQQASDGLRPAVEKELLHYDLLYCLDQAGLLDELVFQGGTSLRLCYGANRLSEDLDFAGGVDFCADQLMQMKATIENYIGQRYGLDVTVKEPNQLRSEQPKYAELAINKWQIAVTTAPAQKDIPRQRIKIEVANIPAYTRQALPLTSHYSFLPDGYDDTLVYTETLDEIMADKLVSLPATRRYVRHRDIWDLAWLQQQGATLNAGLVANKLDDYRITDFDQALQARLSGIKGIIHGESFHDEMKRFVPPSVYERTLAKAKFRDYLQNTITRLLTRLAGQLNGNNNTPPLFDM